MKLYLPNSKKPLVIAAMALSMIATFSARASAESLQNLDDGLAIQGYDPVAYFTDSKPVKGKKTITSTHNGATYRFASEEHKKLFDADPAKYEPQYGGYCAYGLGAKNKLVEIDPEAWTIADGKLYLNYDSDIRETWQKHQTEYIKKADAYYAKRLAAQSK